MSRAHVVILPVVLCVLFCAVAAAAVETKDAVVAVVDDEVITRGRVRERADEALRSLPAPLTREEALQMQAEAFSAALRALIEEELLLAEAERLIEKREGLEQRIEKQLLEHIENERNRLGGPDALRAELKRRGEAYEEYVQRLREQVMRELVLFQFVYRDLSVSPDRMRRYYREHQEAFKEPDRAGCRQIFIRVSDAVSRERAKETAEYVMSLVEKGHDFTQLARDYSDGPHAGEGGLWDFMPRGARPEPIDDLLFSLDRGEVGGPVETDIGFTIVKLEERIEGRLPPYEEVQERIRNQLREAELQRRYRRLMDRLENEHYVERLI